MLQKEKSKIDKEIIYMVCHFFCYLTLSLSSCAQWYELVFGYVKSEFTRINKWSWRNEFHLFVVYLVYDINVIGRWNVMLKMAISDRRNQFERKTTTIVGFARARASFFLSHYHLINDSSLAVRFHRCLSDEFSYVNANNVIMRLKTRSALFSLWLCARLWLRLSSVQTLYFHAYNSTLAKVP